MDKLNTLIKNLESVQKGLESFGVLIKTDEDGCFDKECPNQDCLFLFKIDAGDWTALSLPSSGLCRRRNAISHLKYLITSEGLKNEIHIQSSFPNESLSYFVREIFYLQIDSDREQTMVAIDDGCYDFMFYKEKYATLEFEHIHSVGIASTFLTVHQLNPPLKYRFGKSVSYFGIKAQPWLNNFFFPSKSDKGILNLEHIYSHQMAGVRAIFEGKSFSKKVQLAEDFLTNIQPTINDHMDLVKQVCEEIYRRNGMITVKELSDRFECNRQFLNKTFKAHVNYTLKKFIIIVRVINLAKFRINNPAYSLTEIALEFGYFDQAHFNYDFKRISGVTPKEFFNNLPPFFHRHKNL